MPDKTDFDRAIELNDRLVDMIAERDKWRRSVAKRDCYYSHVMDVNCGKCLPCQARAEIAKEKP